MCVTCSGPCIQYSPDTATQNHPLHISLFPADQRDAVEFDFFLSSSLDVFAARLPSKPADHDFGLLHAVDDQLSLYGWLTNTGVKFVVAVDMEGRPAASEREARNTALLGIRDADLRPAFRAIHRAYIGLLRNPFYDPEAHGSGGREGKGRAGIRSPRFINEIRRIGETWYPGIAAV